MGVYQESGIPHVMNSDPRYRALFQLYRELNNKHLQLQIHKSFSYHWKRTDKLYEIWGYIQFIKALTGEELSFVPKSGWVYSQDFNGNNLLIPALPSNTEVVFRKGNLRINLVYEGLLPTQSKLTTAENPYTQREPIHVLLADLMYMRMKYSLERSYLILNTGQETLYGTKI